MEEDFLITSSPSILVPESPDSSIQGSPGDSVLRLGTHSETYTQLDDSGENAQAAVDNNTLDGYDDVWIPGIVYEDANSANEDSNTNLATQASEPSEPAGPTPEAHEAPWAPVLGVDDDTSAQSTAQRDAITNEDSNAATQSSEQSEPDEHDEAQLERAADEDSSRGDRDKGAEGPPAKVRKLDTSVQDDGDTCPICLEAWGSAGEHRLAALRCGHVFGASCVRRWLRAQRPAARCCPSCKSGAALRDVRHIYARRLVAADTAQLAELHEQIEVLQSEKNRSELELQKTRIAHRACMMQLEDLRKTLLKGQGKEQPARQTWRFALEKNLEVSRDGGCRVLAYNCRTYELFVSQRSSNRLFPGYGVRRVSCVDYTLGPFLHLHAQPIRDLAYSQPRDLLLSVGLDRAARVVERGAPAAAVRCGLPLWACAWDHLRGHEFYVGGVGGVVRQYDLRSPGAPVAQLAAAGDLSPVVSLASTEHGLLACQLNSCWLWSRAGPRWARAPLPAEGPFMSLCYDAESARALVAGRAGAAGERARLALCAVRGAGAGAGAVLERTFAGSARTSVLSRAAFVRAGGAAWAAAHSESDGALELFALDGGRGARLPAADAAVALCAARPAHTVLAALSETRLRLYRAMPAS